MESQPQNPEFRIKPENFQPCIWPSRLCGDCILLCKAACITLKSQMKKE